jgi:hypothetical protein
MGLGAWARRKGAGQDLTRFGRRRSVATMSGADPRDGAPTLSAREAPSAFRSGSKGERVRVAGD